MGPLAKYSAFIGAIIANLIVYGLLVGIFFARRYDRYSKKIPAKFPGHACNFFCYIPSNNDCALGPDRGSGSINIDLVIDYLFNNTTVAFGFTLYAVLYNRTPESVIEVPKERIKASKPDSGEQIDQEQETNASCRYRRAVAIPVIYLGLESLLSPQRAVQSTTSLLLSQFQQKLKNTTKPQGFEIQN